LVDLAQTYCSREDFISVLVVRIGAMDALVHRFIATIIVRVYESLATQWISGGQLKIMQRELSGEHFASDVMLHTKMIG
jgi:hypothetical protein